MCESVLAVRRRKSALGEEGEKILTATGSSKSLVSLFLCCQLASLSLTNCSINSSSFPPSLQLQSSSCLLLVLCYAHRTDPPAGAQTWALYVSAPFFGRDESGVNSTSTYISHQQMHLHDSVTFWKQSEPWWCSKLKTRSFAQRRGCTVCVWGEKSIWWAGDHYGETVLRVCGSLYVISMEIKQRSTERRIPRRDQTQPTTKDQLESKHSLGKNKKIACCKGRISSKIAQKRCLPGLVHGFRKAVRIYIKRKKITSNHPFASRCDAHQLTMEKATGPHVSKLFWAALQYAAGMHTGGYPQGSGPSSDGELQKSLTVSLGVQLDSY